MQSRHMKIALFNTVRGSFFMMPKTRKKHAPPRIKARRRGSDRGSQAGLEEPGNLADWAGVFGGASLDKSERSVNFRFSS